MPPETATPLDELIIVKLYYSVKTQLVTDRKPHTPSDITQLMTKAGKVSGITEAMIVEVMRKPLIDIGASEYFQRTLKQCASEEHF